MKPKIDNLEGGLRKEQEPTMKEVLIEYLSAGPRGMAEGLKELSDATLGRLADSLIGVAEKLKRARKE